ncbi:hypothetical protein IEQ34_008654 [Dendrobium chrysotoxum]|uniref:Uncharacterized protein n=1 Tax=Dendrobium chrysotoxum TaxID=161865 RepID=A0AAV7GZA7_DENCH|nr:hypothetical protein IEQ34_008654 [Dendrobium chrysotoxum]
MSEAYSRVHTIQFYDVYYHLQIFLRLKPLRFESDGSKTDMQYKVAFTSLAKYTPLLLVERARLIKNDVIATHQQWTTSRQ